MTTFTRNLLVAVAAIGLVGGAAYAFAQSSGNADQEKGQAPKQDTRTEAEKRADRRAANEKVAAERKAQQGDKKAGKEEEEEEKKP